MAKKLWVNETTSIDIPDARRSVTPEIASRARSVDFAWEGSFLPNPDPVLKKAGIDQAVYQELLVDPHVGAVFGSRKAGVTSMQWEIEQGYAGAREMELAEKVFATLKVDKLLPQILNAPGFGYQPLEVEWARAGDLFIPTQVISKPSKWFVFSPKNELLFRSRDNWNGEQLKPRRFLLATHEADYENPYGFPVLSRAFFWVTFKKGGIQYWMTFAEKYGMPFLFGKVPEHSSDEQRQKLMDALEKMVHDAVGVINANETVEFLEAGAKSASADLYERLCQYCDTQISKGIVGQTLTTEVGKTGGAYATSQTHQEVRTEIVDGDRKIAETTLNQLIEWLCEVNLGSKVFPKFKLSHPEDLEKRLKLDEGLHKIGVRFKKEYIKDAYNRDEKHFEVSSPAPAGAASALGGPVPPGAPPAPARPPGTSQFAAPPGGRVLSPHALHLHFAERSEARYPDQAALDQAIDTLPAEQLQGFAEGLLKPVWSILEKGGTQEEITEALVGAYADMDDATFQQALTQALFVSEVWGRLNAQNER